MKMYKFEVYVIDYDDNGAEELIKDIDSEYTAYNIKVMDYKTADIGEWTDDHILNFYTTPVEVYREYFEKDKE